MSIETIRLTKKIGSFTILDNIDLKIQRNEIVGLLGPNGAGKTTLMKIITGAIDYTQGYVAVCDIETKKNPHLLSGKIGYLPEHNPLYEDMFVKEYLLFIAELHKLSSADSKSRISELMSQMGLKAVSRKKIAELSKGYKQRVGLAQALISNPELLILDEPTTGLDPNQLEEIYALIREIGKDRTVLLSTHNLQEAKAVCTRALVLHEGKIVADLNGLTEMEVSDENDITLMVEFKDEVDMAKLQQIEGVKKVHQLLSSPSYRLLLTSDIRESIFRFAVTSNNPLLSIHLAAKSLEDVFRESTQQGS